MINSCPSKVHCRIDQCQKRHHTLLHFESEPQNDLNKRHENNGENSESIKLNNHVKSIKRTTYLQILLVTLINDDSVVETNAILDTGSDVTLIRADAAKQLNLKGKPKSLNVCSALSNTSRIPSSTVNFHISSTESKSEKINIDDAWVVENLNIPYDKITQKDIQNYPHLANVNLPCLNNTDVTILIGSDYPDLLLHYEYRKGNNDEPIAIRTKLGWVLMGGRNNPNSQISHSNFMHKDNILESVERFWQLDSYGTLPKLNPNNLPPDQKRALDIL